VTVRKYGLNAKNVIARHAVFEAVCATGIKGDIAAYRTYQLTRWVRRVIETVRFGSMCDMQIHNTRLHNGDSLLWVKFQDFVEAIESDNQPIFDRQ
jgi:hypothetical protein